MALYLGESKSTSISPSLNPLEPSVCVVFEKRNFGSTEKIKLFISIKGVVL